MSGLSLASHPPSGGRRAAPLRRKPRCLRARLVCACPACPPLWGFRLLRFMPGCCPTVLRSHILLAHALWRGRFVFARVGLHLLWACLLAGGWVGCLRYWCVRLGCLRACLCALAWGWWDSVVPPPPFPRLLACVLTPLVWACWRVRGWRVRGGRRAALLGRDNRVPPHTAWRGLLRSPRGAEERGVACGVLPVC